MVDALCSSEHGYWYCDGSMGLKALGSNYGNRLVGLVCTQLEREVGCSCLGLGRQSICYGLFVDPLVFGF